jgi:hypothetical protein
VGDSFPKNLISYLTPCSALACTYASMQPSPREVNKGLTNNFADRANLLAIEI